MPPVFLVLGQNSKLLWQIVYNIWQTLIVGNGQMFQNKLTICGKSYKHFTSVNYDSRVVIWAIF